MHLKILYLYTWEKKSCPSGIFRYTTFIIFVQLFAKNVFFGHFGDFQLGDEPN